MRKIILIMSVFLVAACISEVKPILKPAEFDIPTRITNLEKWLAQDIAAKAIAPQDASRVKDKVKQIKEKYGRLQSAGPLTAKDSDAINRAIDQTLDLMFVLRQKQRTPAAY